MSWAGLPGIRVELRELLGPVLRAAPAIAAVVVLAFVSAEDAYDYDQSFNVTRVVQDLYFRAEPADALDPLLPQALEPMRWQLPFRSLYELTNFNRLLDLLRRGDRNFMLIGDSSILYGLSGRPSTMPVLWLHPGMSLPYASSLAEFTNFERRLLDSLDRYRVGYVILEGERTWNGFTLDYFPAFAREVRGHKCAESRIGRFRVLRIDCADGPPPSDRPAS